MAICPIHVARSPIIRGGQQPLSAENCPSITSQADGEPLVNILNHIREFRVRIGLPELQPDSSGLLSIPHGSRIVAAISSRFCEPDMEQFPNLNFTGFWFHDRPEWRDWRPDRQLERFVEQGNPPLVLTFSSLPLCDPESVLRIHARTAKLLSRRLVVISGWAGFEQRHIPAECRGEVMVTGELPHRWLFDRSAAVIHHGGIGTLAQAVRCGTPMLVEPYGNDQFFNASRVVKLGIGAAANPYWMTPETLALLIDTKVIAKETQQRVRALSGDIADDPGVEHAADLVMAAV
ncbi:MAG: glycosyltransferase family 1 protein [Chlorobiaceae bacterium]|nr:glycosyltransferase family 1 protein [Chlorobiaceae bacterium]